MFERPFLLAYADMAPEPALRGLSRFAPSIGTSPVPTWLVMPEPRLAFAIDPWEERTGYLDLVERATHRWEGACELLGIAGQIDDESLVGSARAHNADVVVGYGLERLGSRDQAAWLRLAVHALDLPALWLVHSDDEAKAGHSSDLRIDTPPRLALWVADPGAAPDALYHAWKRTQANTDLHIVPASASLRTVADDAVRRARASGLRRHQWRVALSSERPDAWLVPVQRVAGVGVKAPTPPLGVDLLPTASVLALPIPADLPPPMWSSSDALSPRAATPLTGLTCAVALEEAAPFLASTTATEERDVVCVVAGQVVGKSELRDGVSPIGHLAAACEAAESPGESVAIGLQPHVEPTAQGAEAISAIAALIPLPTGRVLLLDAACPPTAWGAAREWAPDACLWAIRMDPQVPLAGLRERLAVLECTPWGTELPPLLDAAALLGDAPDGTPPTGVNELRLWRIARRLRLAGVEVPAVIHVGRATADLAEPLLLSAELPATWPAPVPPSPPRPSSSRDALVDTRLRVLCNAVPRHASSIALGLDNQAERSRLLSAIRHTRHSLDLQTYMFEPDDVGRELATAIAEAAARSVHVRILADSIYSRHGSLGAVNPVLDELSRIPGVAVLAWKPVMGMPNLDAMKGRDHRKLTIFDGAVALVSGRNVGTPYYTSYHEIPLYPRAEWRRVPWLDASVWVEGPVVQDIAASFEATWTEAVTGRRRSIDAAERSPSGDSTDLNELDSNGPDRNGRVWFVCHESLRDAHTLEAYLALLDGAERHIRAVNAFPLLPEIRSALVRAFERGVKIAYLFGNPRPLHGEGAGTAFTGGAIRELASQLVHARLDPLVALGVEVIEHRVARFPIWSAGIDVLRPFVHAKLLSVDGRMAAIGSANLDVTAAYWESEALVIVEDAPTVGTLDAWIDEWCAKGRRLSAADPEWTAKAARRAWLDHQWPDWLG